MSWVAEGAFQRELHLMQDEADSMLLERRRYWFATCNLPCVVLPHDADLDKYPLCGKCFPKGLTTSDTKPPEPTANP